LLLCRLPDEMVSAILRLVVQAFRPGVQVLPLPVFWALLPDAVTHT
jgi:hypothetical protein